MAVADIPHTPLADRINGAQIVEYGLHDSHFGSASHPASLLDEMRAAYGPYPVASCDHSGGTTARNLALLDNLLAGVERKTRVLLDLLHREQWDLFACAFSESHCVGHWFWHYSDATHWSFEPDAPPRLRDAVRSVYARLDAAVGALVAAAGAETTVVLASHGMAPYVAGYQLLPEVLARLGLSSGPAGRGEWLRSVQHTARSWVPRRYWERLGRFVVENPTARACVGPLQRERGAMFFPLESPQTRAVYVPNNTLGAIRLNLKGREPFGAVAPGREAECVIAQLRSELLALQHPTRRAPIVSAVITAAEAFGPVHHPDVPDLIVRFRQDLGLLDTCESPSVGRVHVPVGSRWGRRSGDHSPRSAVWVQGPAYPAGAALEAGSLVDIAPTVLASLNCRIPEVMQGAALRPRTGPA